MRTRLGRTLTEQTKICDEHVLRKFIRLAINESLERVSVTDDFKKALEQVLVYIDGVRDPLETALEASPDNPIVRSTIVGIYNDFYQRKAKLRPLIDAMSSGRVPTQRDLNNLGETKTPK